VINPALGPAPDWLAAIGTIAVVTLALALWGRAIGEWFFHPELKLEAKVQRPKSITK
jgi:hypothetical protein